MTGKIVSNLDVGKDKESKEWRGSMFGICGTMHIVQVSSRARTSILVSSSSM